MATTPPPVTPKLDLFTVLSESKRIIHAHSRHFLAISVIFLLPISFSTTIYPTLINLLSLPDSNRTQLRTLLRLHSDAHSITFFSTESTNFIFLAFAYALFVFVLSLFAFGSINYSVFNGFYGRPVKLLFAIKWSLRSFLPLLLTVLVSQIMVALICVAFGIFVFVVIRAIQLFGYQIEYSSPYFMIFCALILIALTLILLYLQVNWALVCVVVVVESSWGFGSLRRSKSLIKGMKAVALSLSLFFGFLMSILVLSSWVSGAKLGGGGIAGWKSWVFVIQLVVTSALITMLLLYNVAATTVIYMYCKAVHGELAMEVANEFAWDYVFLPFDDEKVPHVISIIPD